MRRIIIFIVVGCVLPPAFGHTVVQQTDTHLTLSNGRCLVKLDVGAGSGSIVEVRLAGHEENLVNRAVTTLYFAESKHWVDESKTSATSVEVLDVAGGKSVQVDARSFGGFRLRKTVTLRDDASVIQVSYQLVASTETKPHLICPVSLSCPVALDRLAAPGGEVAAEDIAVSDFAMKLSAKWYAFLSAQTRAGVALAPISWPDMYKVNWIGRKPEGNLNLYTRLHPMRTFRVGAEVRFSYNIAPFTGTPQDAAQMALKAGAGPLQPLPTGAGPAPAAQTAAPAAAVRPSGLNSAIYPAEEDDNRLFVAKGTTQHFFFVPANHSETSYEKFSFVLILPEGIDIMQASGDVLPHYYRPVLKQKETVERDGKPMAKWVWESDRALGPRDIEKVRFYSTWCGALAPGDALAAGKHEFYFHLQAQGEREPEHVGELIILPEPQGRQPKSIVIGMSGWTISPTTEFWNKLLDTYQKCGINLVDSHLQARDAEWAAPVRAAGMRSWKLVWWFWWNDEYLQAHPEHAAVKFDGEPDKKMVCPEIMAAEDSNAIEGLMKPIVEAVKAGNIEGMWWDLEGPGCFRVCFCPRCLAAFRRFAGIPDDEELTPLAIQAKHGEKWMDFACRQSGRVAARMKSYARAAGADWKLAVYCAVQNDHTRRAYRVDWRTLTPQIDVATPSFYSFNPSDLSTRFTSGLGEFIGLVRGIKDIPVWTTLTTGSGRGEPYVRDGRLTKMQIIKSIAYGAQGTVQWWWGPVDGRHYQAYAEATALISELEEFFTRGQIAQGFLSGDRPEGTTRIAWRLGDRTLVMLFNDTVTGPLTVTAQVPAAGHRIVRDDGRNEIKLEGTVLRAPVEPLDCRWAILTGHGE